MTLRLKYSAIQISDCPHLQLHLRLWLACGVWAVGFLGPLVSQEEGVLWPTHVLQVLLDFGC